ncbi:MAG: ribosome recycling factor [Candidatus Cloacimonetes bacterium]|nr:ribosome recycling factor [Candidatus Cloacimonadota bacterium]
MHEILSQLEEKMMKTLDSLYHNFNKIRTGRASAAVLDDIKVNYYGSQTLIKQISNINIPEPRLIVIQPFDVSTMGEIVKAIQAANLGITPENDGKIIRLPFPQLTEDKRKEIVKQVKKVVEDTKIALRNIRRDQNEEVKKSKKNNELTEDQEKKMLDDIQKATDRWIEKVEEIAQNKEKEILTI